MARSKPMKTKPSRARYEEANPTMSFRLPREIRDRLVAHLKALGQSFAGWVKDHLDQDEARAKARAEVLAEQRGNLARELKRLERLIEQRQLQLDVPIEEEKKHRRHELDDWYKREKRNVESNLSFGLIALERVREQIRQQKECFEEEAERLRALRLQLVALEGQKAALKEQTNRWLRQIQAGMRLINQWPWLFCNQCPEFGWRRMILNMAQEIAQSQTPTTTS